MAQSSCLTPKPKYDVFLSFRGRDTRYAFTGNLYFALCQKGINTFMDEEELGRGEQISPTLLNAIEESRISMIVFSENYASSTWCLDELVKILECMKKQNQLVFPIFYKIEPSTIRHQINSYGEAIAKHEKRYKDEMDKVQNWRLALFEASNLSGWEFKSGYEYQFIQIIVEEAFAKLKPKDLHVAANLVGLKFHMKEVISLLDIENNNDSLMLGIYGLGGIGKTTLARVLYNQIVNQFECSCFLDDVKEVSNSKGILELLKTLLNKTLGKKSIKLSNVNEGILIIKNRLQSKRVLIILDDVDKMEHLQMLVGACDWFGHGSRIIITTRNKHLLTAHQIQRTYQMKKLDDYEALELFSWNAFKMIKPPVSHLNISKRIVHYAKGHPLALKVIGSDLFGKRLDEWECALEKYEKIPNRDLQKVLKISYDSLEENEKNIFLDIVCFFKRETLEYVEKILDACNFYPRFGIGVLVDKSLISIERGCLRMHDLIRDMGREIIRLSSPLEPGKRSRLWFREDVLEVLMHNTGTKNIEGIMLDLPKQEEVQWSGMAFKKMKNLRILIIRNAIFSIGPKYLPNNLRLFEWDRYPSITLPPDFHPRKLVVFNLPSSYIQLDKPFKEFQILTQMNFKGCDFLTQIPDVSRVPNLQYLHLQDCKNLVKIDDSVGFHGKLVGLYANGCSKLKYFPRDIHLTSLEILLLNDTGLEFLPNVLGKMESLKTFLFSNNAIKELPDSFCTLTSLSWIHVGSCICLPRAFFMLPQLEELKMSDCQSLRQIHAICNPILRRLTLDNCCLSDDDICMIFNYFPNLCSLRLPGCNLKGLPTCIKEAVHLTNLDVSGCENLREIPELPLNLQKVNARYCKSLTSESASRLWIQAFKEVYKLNIKMPTTKFPEWFDHHDKGEKVSFWVRQKFPALALAFVFKKLDELENENLSDFGLYISNFLEVLIFINGIKVGGNFYDRVFGGHVWLFDIGYVFYKNWISLNVFLVHDWNYVEIYCSNAIPKSPKSPQMTVEYWGVHVYKKETNMDYIQFHCPLKRPASFSPQQYKRKGKLPVNLFKQLVSFYPQHGRPKKLIKGTKDDGKGKL